MIGSSHLGCQITKGRASIEGMKFRVGSLSERRAICSGGQGGRSLMDTYIGSGQRIN